MSYLAIGPGWDPQRCQQENRNAHVQTSMCVSFQNLHGSECIAHMPTPTPLTNHSACVQPRFASMSSSLLRTCQAAGRFFTSWREGQGKRVLQRAARRGTMGHSVQPGELNAADNRLGTWLAPWPSLREGACWLRRRPVMRPLMPLTCRSVCHICTLLSGHPISTPSPVTVPALDMSLGDGRTRAPSESAGCRWQA